MAIKVHNADVLKYLLEQIGPKAVDAARETMRRKSYEIRDLARRNAPRDLGNLEDAIIVVEDREGINRRKRFAVTVDEDHEGDGPGRTVGQYATVMHEGAYALGDESYAKQQADPEANVGPKYLESAAYDVLDTIVPDMIKDIKKLRGID